ncbi:MAG: beta-ketoacyl-[acyl-carrier-protein] synthase II, partial [Bacteroidia bacterium]|nr:beta-ketoacyl-[acyl-carrier-protein] synthase II [Bacteroidia bacterium]
EGRGAQQAMQEALTEAGLSPAEVDYVNMHATSTSVGDTSEIHAVNALFGEAINKVQLSSTKSMTGHLLGAAGAIEAIASILAMEHSLIPPTINQFNRDPEIAPQINLTPNERINCEVKVAMSNTFGFGGHNAIVVFKKFS